MTYRFYKYEEVTNSSDRFISVENLAVLSIGAQSTEVQLQLIYVDKSMFFSSFLPSYLYRKMFKICNFQVSSSNCLLFLRYKASHTITCSFKEYRFKEQNNRIEESEAEKEYISNKKRKALINL